MRVSINWLKELVEINKPLNELVELINLRTLGTKEVTDRYIELDMKGYNRADLLSLRGVALETAAILDSKVKFEEEGTDKYFWVDKSVPNLEINVEDEKMALVYCLAKIEGIKVDKSPREWIEKLEESGFRNVNNIADLTNLIMLEYGQPMHAFDSGKVKGNVGVRLAKENEQIVTLDNKTSQLTKEDLLIVDESGPIGLAGVMGGKKSEISDSTTSVLLEAAIFDPSTLRKTATRLGLTSEASKRFYHGLSKKRLLQALNQALKTFESLGGKVTHLTLSGDFEEESPKIPVRLEKINSLVGVEFSKSQVEDNLRRLNFNLMGTGNSWTVTAPYYRLDVSIEEDVIEEIARMYGYEKIKPHPLPGNPPAPSDQALFELLEKTRTELAGLGLTEVQTYSFYSTAVLEALGFNDEFKKFLVKIANPISAETEYLRMNVWPNLVEAAAKNRKQGIKDMAIFEVGKVYIHDKEGKVGEKHRLAVLLINETDNPLSELKAVFEKLRLGVDINESKEQGPAKDLFHPNRFLNIKFKGVDIGGEAEVHARILDRLGVKGRVAILEIDLEKLV